MLNLIIKEGLPALMGMALAWWAVKTWWVKAVPVQIEEAKKIRKASKKHKKAIDKLP